MNESSGKPNTDSKEAESTTKKIYFQQWTTQTDDIQSTKTVEAGDLIRNTRSVFRLPKMDINPYDGDPKKWPDFIAIFRDLVHSDSTTEKMAILKRSLSDEIRNGLVDSLSSPALYHEALTELETTYGHPQIVSRAYIQSLIELPKVPSNEQDFTKVFSSSHGGCIIIKTRRLRS